MVAVATQSKRSLRLEQISTTEASALALSVQKDGRASSEAVTVRHERNVVEEPQLGVQVIGILNCIVPMRITIGKLC